MKTRDLLVAAAALTGCTPEYEPVDLVPIMVVDPDQLDFGAVGVADHIVAEETILISNAGKAELEVTSITLEGQVEPYTIEPASLTVPANDEAEVLVRFKPLQEYRTYEARAVIESDDEDNPVEVVPITGTGTEEPLPDIAIMVNNRESRTVTSSEDLEYGETEQLVFEIKNVGQAELRIEELTIEPLYGADPSTFAFDHPPPAGRAIAPNRSELVVVRYAPDDEVGEVAVVRVESNDPDEPDEDDDGLGETLVQLVGNGGGPYFAPPVAVIDCPAEVLLTGPEWVHLDGSGSYDPAGFGLTYQWAVIPPPGSDHGSFPVDPDDAPEADVYTDIAGTWLVSLVVTNELGAVSEPALCQFGAIPEDNIHVELTWADASTDLDLHLVQSGYELFSVPEDCNWCNKTPDWGVENDTNDDPRLDIDDRIGLGPENINVYRPVDGVYKVAVHFWNPQTGPTVDVATVRVWLDGVELPSSPLVQVLNDNEVWEVGEIYVSSGVSSWIPLGTVDDAVTRGCQN